MIHQTSNQIDQFDRVGTDSFTAPSPNTLFRYSEKSDYQNSEHQTDNQSQEQSSSNGESEVSKNTDNNEIADIPENKDNNLLNKPTNKLLLSVLSGDWAIDKVDINELPNLIQALKEERDYKISHHNIDDAERIDQILFSARQDYNKRMKDNAMKVRLNSLEERISTAKANLENAKHSFFLERIALEESHKTQIHELGQRQVHEAEQLRNSWRSSKYQRMFNKPSPELQTLYFQTSLLQRDKDRQIEQRSAQKQFRSLCQKEKSEKSRIMNIEYQNSLKKLERKQKNELNILLQKHNEKIEELSLRETNKIRSLEQRLNNLLKEREEVTNSTKSFNHFPESRFQKKKKKASENNQMAQTKPCFADFVKLPLLPLSSTSPRRMRLKTPRLDSTS